MNNLYVSRTLLVLGEMNGDLEEGLADLSRREQMRAERPGRFAKWREGRRQAKAKKAETAARAKTEKGLRRQSFFRRIFKPGEAEKERQERQQKGVSSAVSRAFSRGAAFGAGRKPRDPNRYMTAAPAGRTKGAADRLRGMRAAPERLKQQREKEKREGTAAKGAGERMRAKIKDRKRAYLLKRGGKLKARPKAGAAPAAQPAAAPKVTAKPKDAGTGSTRGMDPAAQAKPESRYQAARRRSNERSDALTARKAAGAPATPTFKKAPRQRQAPPPLPTRPTAGRQTAGAMAQQKGSVGARGQQLKATFKRPEAGPKRAFTGAAGKGKVAGGEHPLVTKRRVAAAAGREMANLTLGKRGPAKKPIDRSMSKRSAQRLRTPGAAPAVPGFRTTASRERTRANLAGSRKRRDVAASSIDVPLALLVQEWTNSAVSRLG